MLKRGILIMMFAAAFAVSACEDDDTPTSPADPNLAIFTAQLSALNEVGGGTPPATGLETNARGDVRIEFRLNRDAGNAITGATATFIVNLSGLPAGSRWILAHIHRGVAGVAGGVEVNTGLTADTGIDMINGGVTGQRFENRPVDQSDTHEILNNPSGFYFNAHTVANPTGVVRGQLVRIQ